LVVIANPCRIDGAWPNFCHLLLSTGTESAFFAGGVSTRKTSKKSTKKWCFRVRERRLRSVRGKRDLAFVKSLLPAVDPFERASQERPQRPSESPRNIEWARASRGAPAEAC
jgi:hypothetical protein